MAPLVRVPANFGTEHINSPVHGNLLLKLREGQQMRTNSMIMSLNSPVIDHLTTVLFQSTIEVDDFTKESVECFVEALYSGEVDKLKKQIFEDVNKMAHVFNVSWLTKRCMKFYKTDVLNFENNSYEEILFSCEIASRAHYNLKQSEYVSCFVRNMTSRNIGKMIFLQRYMADFAELSRRQIDMSLAVAGNDSKLIIIPLISHVTRTFKCKKLDENSLYLLQHFNVRKFRQDFPIDFDDTANFLTEIADVSESSEEEEIIKKFVETKCDAPSSSSKDDIVEVSKTTEDCDDSDCEDNADVAIQTDEAEYYDWMKPVGDKNYSLSPGESVHMITGDNESQHYILVHYTLTREGRSDKKWFKIRCDNINTSQWSYIIEGCTVDSWNTRLMNNVPPDKVKYWIITKTSTHLKVVCNRVTVLNFNFATDCDSDKRNGEKVWSRNAKSFLFYYHNYNTLLVRTIVGF